MDDYKSIFSQRADEYHEAGVLYPKARETERKIMVDWLDVQAGDVICDIPSGGGYLSEGLERLVSHEQIICVEPVFEFARAVPKRFFRTLMAFENICIKDASIDKIGSLTGLHHEEHKQNFFDETFRILKASGVMIVADVKVGSSPALWLNGPVDRYSSTGHKGMFLGEGEFSGYFKKAGFSEVEEKYCEYTWTFPDKKALIFYCRKLFGLSKADDETIENEIHNHFQIVQKDNGVELPWSLIYARGIK